MPDETRVREAAREAWNKCMAWYESDKSPNDSATAARDRYLARAYPAPVPPSVTLSDGSVVSDDPRNGAGRIKWTRLDKSAWFMPGEVEAATRILPDADRWAFRDFAARLDAERAK